MGSWNNFHYGKSVHFHYVFKNFHIGYFCNCSAFTSCHIQYSRIKKALSHPVFCCITILFHPCVVTYSHCTYSIPIMCSVIFPLYIFYSHYAYCIPIMCSVIFPLYIFYSHYVFCDISIVHILFPLYILYSH